MDVLMVPSAFAAGGEQYLTSYLINGRVAVDAGCAGFHGRARDQAKIRHVFVSHSHIDHIASLPVLVENAYDPARDGLVIHGGEAVLDCLRRDFFNDRVWPDLSRPFEAGAPFFLFDLLRPGRPVEVEGLRITPVDVDHTVPTQGFLIDDGRSSVLIASDTGPTEAIWRLADRAENLRAVFLEASFPNAFRWLAALTKHLTPELLAAEMRKLRSCSPRFLAVHIKAQHIEQVVAELAALALPNLEVARFGEMYTF